MKQDMRMGPEEVSATGVMVGTDKDRSGTYHWDLRTNEGLRQAEATKSKTVEDGLGLQSALS